MAPGRRSHDPLQGRVRAADGGAQPSAAVLDSQSVKSSEGGEQIGSHSVCTGRACLGAAWRQYAPPPLSTARTVFTRISASRASVQFST